MLDLARIEWRRRDQPILSAMTTAQAWCRVQLFHPCVVRHDGRYLMWHMGNASATRRSDMAVGLAESDDGLTWRQHPGNPVLTSDDLPWADGWDTPMVRFHPQRGVFQMWFTGSSHRHDGGASPLLQQLGYAESDDGLRWRVHPEPIYPTARGACVLTDGAGYVAWMNSAPHPDDGFDQLVSHIYRFTSDDGLAWRRDPEPAVAVTPQDEIRRSCVYPWVLRQHAGYVMWYGCHRPDQCFEIYASTSSDGLTWADHVDEPGFPATRSPVRYDGRYTSTPCVIEEDDRYLLYFSTRDLGALYGRGDGLLGADAMGVYRHLGVAVAPKPC